MNKEPILLVMAAGMGSRYGGLKQMDPVGPDGEVILHYSVYDARRAGFKRVIFLIKHEIEEDFKAIVGRKVEPYMEVSYAFQQLDRLPAPYTVPAGRTKPWGTGHAVLCCKDLIDAPFCVVNADDYYGVDAFRTAYEFLKDAQDDDRKHYMMVGYLLKNTVTENGHVARGICSVDSKGNLLSICERTHIISTCDGPLFTEDGSHYELLSPDTYVSMNLWGFTPSLVDELEKEFPAFLDQALASNPLKGEYFLPTVVGNMLKSGKADARLLPSHDKWYGVTYKEDKPVVKNALAAMAESGLYPRSLWKAQ